MHDFLSLPSSQTVTERREAAEQEKLHRTAERQRLLSTLKSSRHVAKDRIRLWEQLFGIHLPKDTDHKLVGVIAMQTALPESEVRLEQKRRHSELNPPAAVATVVDKEL
jgi:hypothetical protein